VPDHSDASGAGLATRMVARNVNSWHLRRMPAGHLLRRSQGFLDRDIDRVELMVARHLLGGCAVAEILEDDEVAY
jgi:hypothetical protein